MFKELPKIDEHQKTITAAHADQRTTKEMTQEAVSVSFFDGMPSSIARIYSSSINIQTYNQRCNLR